MITWRFMTARCLTCRRGRMGVSRLPIIHDGAVGAVDRVGFGEGDASDVVVGPGTFVRFAVAHVPVLAFRITAHDGEVVGGVEVFVARDGGDQNHVADVHYICDARFTAELNLGGAAVADE